MKDRDDPRAALSVAVIAGRAAAIAAASFLSGQLPPAFVALGLACAVCLILAPGRGYLWLLVVLDLTLAVAYGLTTEAGTFSRIAIAGAAAQAGAVLGLPGAIAALPTAIVAWWAPVAGVLMAGLGRLWHELMERRARAVQAAAADERARLAREMHDSLSKTIDAIALGAAALPHMLGEPDRATRLAHTLRDGSLIAARDARELIDELRTPAAVQLAEDIPRICRDWTAVFGVPVEVSVAGIDLASPVAADLAWILREALRNVATHARAGRVRVSLTAQSEHVTLTVEDDGIGLAVVPDAAKLLHAGHHGLVGMAERARACGGSLQVDPSPLGGTRIAATVPRNAAPTATGLPARWRAAVIAAAAAGCGALVVVLSAASPKTPHDAAPPLAPTPSTVVSASFSAFPSAGPGAVVSASPPPSAGPAPTGPTPAASQAAALSCHVKYAKQSEWTPGFVADITLSNTGTKPIDGWKLTFTLGAGQKVTNGWNAIFTQNGSTVTAEATSSTPRIAPDTAVMLGFQGTWSGRNPVPKQFTVNGVRCTTPY